MIAARPLRRIAGRTRLRDAVLWWRDRSLRPADVLIASYPRSGSTWLRFMVFSLLTGERPTFDAVNTQIPQVGAGRPRCLLPDGGRVLKTHELRRPRYPRAIYVLRDPRDVVLSERAYQYKLGTFDGTIEEFAALFVAGRANPYGSWSQHVLSWTGPRRPGLDESLIVRYEDLRRETPRVLGSIADFLGAEASMAELERVADSNSIKAMRREELEARREFKGTRDDVRFVRKGRVGGWSDELPGPVVELIQGAFESEMKALDYL